MPFEEINGARISYGDAGAGHPVVMIHCSAASGNAWDRLRDDLGGGFRSITPDQWSCGQSDPWPGSGPFSLAGEARPVAAIIDDIGEPVHLIGHSYGGAVALRTALMRPAAVVSLTLVEPSAFHLLRQNARAEKALFAEIAAVARAVRVATSNGDHWSGMQRFVDYWNGEGAWQAMSQGARIKLARRLPPVALAFRALFGETSTLADYAGIGAPTLILCGEASPAPSQRLTRMLAAAMPAARLETIAGAGHMSPFTHAGAVNAAIIRHLHALTPQAEEAKILAA